MTTLQRIKQYIDYKGFSNKKFEEETGFSNGAFSSQLKKNRTIGVDKLENILKRYPDLNPDWLLTNRGEMLRSGKSMTDNKVNSFSNNQKKPLIPINKINKWGDETGIIDDYKIALYCVPDFENLNVDFLINVTDNSMYPKFNSRDVIACKKIPANTFFQWNKIYIIDSIQGAIVKRIKKSSIPNHILCVSDNTEYDAFDLHIDEIRTLAIVLGTIRLE